MVCIYVILFGIEIKRGINASSCVCRRAFGHPLSQFKYVGSITTRSQSQGKYIFKVNKKMSKSKGIAVADQAWGRRLRRARGNSTVARAMEFSIAVTRVASCVTRAASCVIAPPAGRSGSPTAASRSKRSARDSRCISSNRATANNKYPYQKSFFIEYAARCISIAK